MIDKDIKYEDRTGFFLGGGGGADYSIGGGGNPANAPSSSAPTGGGGNDNDNRREQYSVTRTVTPKDKEVKVTPPGPVERDTGLERQRQKNIALVENLKNTTYKDLDKNLVPPYIPYSGAINTVGNLLGSFGFEKNRDFFVENVAGKYGYGYGLEDFEQYMQDRVSGKVGPYGNEAQGQNALSRPDDATDTSGILEALIQPIEKPEETISPIKGFDYVPYSNQVVVAPGREGLEALMGRGRRKEFPQPFRGETFSEVPEQYKAGFDAYTQENPIGVGGQAMSSVMLPDGNRVMFTNTASAGAFRNYLESIGVLSPTETSDEDSFSQIVI